VNDYKQPSQFATQNNVPVV